MSSTSSLVQTAEGEGQVTMPLGRSKVPKGLRGTLVCFLTSDVLSLGIGYTRSSQSAYIH